MRSMRTRCVVLMAVIFEEAVLWDVIPCGLADIY
jgi:hypothetical protein